MLENSDTLNIISLEIKQCQPQQLTIYKYQTELVPIALPSLLAIAANS